MPYIPEERCVYSNFKPVSEISPEEDIWEKEEDIWEEEEDIWEKEEEEEEEEEEEDMGIKTLLSVPRQESVWGLVAWPRASPEQAPWWEDLSFSLPPLPGPCECSLRTEVTLFPEPSGTSSSTLQSLPYLSPKLESTSLGDQPQKELCQSASHKKTPKIRRRRPHKARRQASPKRSTASQSLRQLAPISVWPPIFIQTPTKGSALRGSRAPLARKGSHTSHDSPLPQLSSK
ncbi:peroxisome proliferator-activated receptor gamma coactivator 1-beta-like [Sciurus carolinensis]|uniref:peroxisome proliferator-activated receptor gamma coactivator 1-beta-like n=1 Tax=Sciurus carolinensis TaxID=30640 RepID=UPI001FB1E80D|nr:peroxisome proliferator-activated receptor gamma coactivator 1-beta-like [Sciurus carolinensis]